MPVSRLQLLKQHWPTLTGALVGLALSGSWLKSNPGSVLEYFAMPGAFAFILISGGEAGGPDILQYVGIIAGVIVNAFLYAFLGLLLGKFRPTRRSS